MGTPKALLEFRGETFLDRLAGIFEKHCSQVVVVLGHDAGRIRSGVRQGPDFVFNPDHALGQLTSLQCGLRAVLSGTGAVLFTPVDYPAIQPETVKALLNAHAEGVLAAVPRHEGRHGHPVLVDGSLIPAFLALGKDSTARDVMHRVIAETEYVDVPDPGILLDVDDPVVYAKLQAQA